MATGLLARGALLLAAVSAAGLLAAAPSASAAAPTTPAPPLTASTASSATPVAQCAVVPGRRSCLAERVPLPAPTAAQPNGRTAATAATSGYAPADLKSAYKLPNATTTATVAVVDAYDAPTIESDLAAYRATYGLPACTSANGCFQKVNQEGTAGPLPGLEPDPDGAGWAGESTLDVEMVSAVCPTCHILLVEADDDDRSGQADLELGVRQAVALGAKYVSMSWGGTEFGAETSFDAQYFPANTGVVYTAASGDNGYGSWWPAADPNVVSVGGTALSPANNARGWTEAAWGNGVSSPRGDGTGSGCSAVETRAHWQVIAPISTLCPRRALNDVSVVGDPSTGVRVYQGGAWWKYGGTSVGAPLIAAMYALAGPASTVPAPAYPYLRRTSFNDVTSGVNGSCGNALCRAGAGWDGPTGLGSPNGVVGFLAVAPSTIKLRNPGTQTSWSGSPSGINVQGVDSSRLAITYTTSGLPPGTSMRVDGIIVGTPTHPATYQVVVTGRDPLGSTGQVSFRWTVKPHHIVPAYTPRIAGALHRGSVVTAVWGGFHLDVVHGAALRPVTHVRWYANGRIISGATGLSFKIPANYAHALLQYKVTATQIYYVSYTYSTPRSAPVS